jgi:hypothetical protein
MSLGNSDVESIEAGLRTGEHQQEPFRRLLDDATSIIQQPPDDMDETWHHGALVGRMVRDVLDQFALAESFRQAGDLLVEAIHRSAEAYEVIYPIMFVYRHATELYLKALLTPKTKNHDLKQLLIELGKNQNVVVPDWLAIFVLNFDEFDQCSTTFRYSDNGVVSSKTGDAGEFWIDLPEIKGKMGHLAEWFRALRAGLVDD